MGIIAAELVDADRTPENESCDILRKHDNTGG